MAERKPKPVRGDVRFVGSIPEVYDRYLGSLLFSQYAADLAECIRASGRAAAAVLEIAAGTGILTERLRSILPPGVALTATDLNALMLAVAQQQLQQA